MPSRDKDACGEAAMPRGDIRTFDDKGRELVEVFDRVIWRGGSGGDGPATVAPPWLHKLVDLIWDFFSS